MMTHRFNKITLALLSLGLLPFSYADTPTDTPNQEQVQDASVEPTELETIEVTARAQKAISEATNSYQRDRVNLGLLGRQNAFTSPITVVNYDEKAFADKNPRTMVDVLSKTDASVMQFGGESNTLQGIYVRGLQLDTRQFSVNGLAGMYSTYNSPSANVAAMQVIKGASSATVGMDPEGAVGAAVNVETKRASDEGNRNIGLAWISDSRWQPSIDFGRRFGENKQWGVRLNAKYRDGDTPRDGYSEEVKEAALNVDYRGETFNAALDLAYAKRTADGGRARLQDIQAYGFQLPAAPDGKTNLSPSWYGTTTEDRSAIFTFDWTPSAWVSISGGLGHMESRFNGAFSQIYLQDPSGTTARGTYGAYGTFSNGTYNANTDRFSAVGGYPIDFISRTTSANLKARGYFETGSVTHNWNTSLDWVKRSRDHDSGNYAGGRVANNYIRNLSIYDPVFPSAPTFTTDLRQGEDTTYTAPSWAFSDTLGFADNQYRLTLGGRLQWIKQENHSAGVKFTDHRFSPMVTAAWVPNQDLMVYANYLEDLEPGATDDVTNEMLPPLVSRQFEVGVRKNFGDVVMTASAYQITKPGSWRIANGVMHVAGEQQGKQRNRGVEFNVYANLLDKTLRPTFGIAYTQPRLIDYPGHSGELLNGEQVASPRVIAKAAVEWDTPFARGLTLNAGVQHYGKSYQDSARTHAFPSYTLVDVGAKYEINFSDDRRLVLRAAVENVFNKNYWQVQRGLRDRSFAVVGLPRTFWLKADYSF